MHIIIGLGNIGSEYKHTRHNIGFMAIDNFVIQNELRQVSNKLNSIYYTGNINNQKVIFAKPQTYMNLSGKAVISLATFYKVKPSNIIVIHDDIDLKFGDIRHKIGGGNGGHNGLKSIDELIGKEYWRIRIGVGRPVDSNLVSSYVLSNFNNDEVEKLDSLFKSSFNIITSLLI